MARPLARAAAGAALLAALGLGAVSVASAQDDSTTTTPDTTQPDTSQPDVAPPGPPGQPPTDEQGPPVEPPADGEPCDNHRDCTGPALCAPTTDVFGCAHPGGCCAAYCDTTDPASCPPGPGGHLCVPFAPPGAPPQLGLCTLP